MEMHTFSRGPYECAYVSVRACVCTRSAASYCAMYVYLRCACTLEEKCYLRLGRPPRHVAVCAARENEETMSFLAVVPYVYLSSLLSLFVFSFSFLSTSARSGNLRPLDCLLGYVVDAPSDLRKSENAMKISVPRAPCCVPQS